MDEEMAVACTGMVPGRNTECSYTRDDYNVAVLGVFGTDGTGAGARDQRGRGFHVEGLLWQLAQEPVGQIKWIMDHDRLGFSSCHLTHSRHPHPHHSPHLEVQCSIPLGIKYPLDSTDSTDSTNKYQLPGTSYVSGHSLPQ